MIIFTTALRVAFALMAVSSLVAQHQPRDVGTYGDVWEPCGSLDWALESGGQLDCMGSAATGGATTSTVISSPGGLFALPGSRCLFCGQTSSGQGVIQLWEYAAGSGLSLVAERTDGGADYVGIVHSTASGALYVLDAASNSILCGTWDPALPLAGVSFSICFSPSMVPALSSAGSKTIVKWGDDLGVIKWPRVGGAEGERLDVSTGLPSTQPLTSAPSSMDVYAIPVLHSEGDLVAHIKAPLGVPFEFVKIETGAVLGVGVGAGVEVDTEVPLLEALELGSHYGARALGGALHANAPFECVRRYGQSDALSDGTQMMPFFFQRGAASGSVFNVQLILDRQPVVGDAHFDCYLLIAFRAPLDPVVQVGGGFLLDTSLYVPADAWIRSDCSQGGVSVDIPVPDGLTGLVFLVQYLVLDVGEYKRSQIYGAELK